MSDEVKYLPDMWHVTWQEYFEKRLTNIHPVESTGYRFGSQVIYTHPLLWIRRYPLFTLMSWQKFTEEDVAAHQEAQACEARKLAMEA